jgi:hypothetical protein
MAARTALVLGIAGLLSLTGTSLGQNALGDGRALDRNMQRGSGGVNTQVRDINAQIKLNNAIVTGNAGFGRSFRGNVGYLAADDFRAGLGSNDLFRERQLSAGSAYLGGAAGTGTGMFSGSDTAGAGSARVVQSGLRGTDALRYQMSMTTGAAVPEDAGISLTTRRAGTGASGRTVGNSIRSTAEFRAQRSVQPTVLGTDVIDGQAYALLASPLMGVKLRGIETEGNPNTTTPTPDAPSKWRPTGVEAQARMARERGTPTPEAPRPGAVNTRVNHVEDGAVSGVLNRFRDETMARSGATPRIDTSARPPETTPGDRSNAPGATPTPSGPTNPNAPKTPGDQPARPGDKPVPGPGAAPGDEAPVPAWMQSLEDMRRSLRGEPPRRATDKKPGEQKPDESATDPLRKPLVPMTADERRVDLDNRVKRLLDAQGFEEKDAFTVEQVEAAKKARVKVDSMSAAAANSSVLHIECMVEGERAMREERFFDAEDAFSRALSASPRDALAQAGRVHAQIGAGLYMSAAANLRELIAARPEMIGVKYGAKVMPSAERLKTTREQLAKAAARTDTALAGDAGLLVAYLGYQAGDLAAVDAGLKAFGAKIEPDNAADLALLELAAKVWKSPVPADLPVLERAPAQDAAPAATPKPAGASDDPNK